MKMIKFLCLVIAALVVTSVTYSNHSLDDSQRVSDLTREIAEIEKNNTVLRSQIADAGSLTKMNERVQAMGFTEVPKIVSITAGSLALR